MLKTYIRKLPFKIKARQLQLGDVAYDAEGKVLYFQPGDMLIELETDRYTMSRALFDELYEEVAIGENNSGPLQAPTL